jgi:DNA-binding response OmpR family regulator
LGQRIDDGFKIHRGNPAARRLEGANILVVEDEAVIATEITSSLEDEGAQVIGPAHTLDRAVIFASKFDISAAILDLRLGAASVAPVARLLSGRKIPFLFYSGQSRTDPAKAEWPKSEIFSKPCSPDILIGALAGLIAENKSQSAPHMIDCPVSASRN